MAYLLLAFLVIVVQLAMKSIYMLVLVVNSHRQIFVLKEEMDLISVSIMDHVETMFYWVVIVLLGL